MPIIWDKRGNHGSRVRGTDEFILKWWTDNREKQWSPVHGLHFGLCDEPNEIILKEFEKSLDKVKIAGDTDKEEISDYVSVVN